MKEYTRKELISICSKAIVPVDKWMDRDTPGAHCAVGECWAYLKAGCPFEVITEDEVLNPNKNTIWLKVGHPTFGSFDYGARWEEETYYLPTQKRLDEVKGGDWY